MSKTLVGILEIGAAIALQFVPGLGTVAGITLGISLGATGLATLLSKTPRPNQTYQAIKTERPARFSAYGLNRLHGAYILYVTNDAGTAVDVYAFQDGKLNHVRRTLLGEKIVLASNGGFVGAGHVGEWGSDKVTIGWNYGEASETAFSQVIAAVPDQWSSDHRGDGVACGYAIFQPVKSSHFSEVYPDGGPNATPLSIVAECQLVYDWRDPAQAPGDPRTWTFSENAILHTAHYLLVRMSIGPTRPPSDLAYWSDISALYTARWNKKFAPSLDYWTDAANDADLPMDRVAFQTITIADDSDDSDLTIQVADARGLAVGMSVTIGDASQSDTCIVTNVSGVTIGISPEVSQFYPSGTQVTWTADADHPITEPRYRSCVAHQHTDAHKDVIAHLLACFDGWLVTRSDGAYVVYSGRYIAPDPDDVLGPSEIISYSLQEGVNEEDAINTLKVTYVSDPHNFNTPDTDDWTDEDDISRRGKALSDQLDNQVPSHAQARRLAKRKMAQILAPQRGNLTAFASARRFLAKRYIPILLREGGVTFFEGVVEVEKVTRNMTTGALSIDWHAADQNVDAWDADTEEGNPSPVGNRVAAIPPAAPVITSATANFGTDSATGVAGVFIDIIASSPDRDDLIWYVRTRQTGFTTWGTREYDDVPAGTSIEIATEFVPADASIEVEIAYQTGSGVNSDWSATATVNTSSANVAPGKVTGLAATGGTGQATVSWNNPTTANLASERLYRNTTNSFGSATIVATYTDPGGTASSKTITLPAGSYYFWVTTISTGGAEGNPVGPVSATVA